MSERKRKIRTIQIFLLSLSLIIIFATYFKENDKPQKKIVSKIDKEKMKESENNSENQDMFYNVRYSGLDLSGNRYILQSDEATVDNDNQEIINMKFVKAKFFFSDNTVLLITSNKGVYNNKTLDMIFNNNVKVNYEDSRLFGEEVSYLNLEKKLLVSNNVKVEDVRGTMLADELLFDLEKKTLDISSYKNKINTNLNLK